MPKTIAKMSRAELQELIESAVEQKLQEYLGDPDAGMTVRRRLVSRLRKQRTAVKAGDLGLPLAEASRRLGLE